jgi:CMP-N,N'-diacetyllegionaminic acid synthase
MKFVALIPARAGSKGIPDKNIKLINGKPLIAWSIEQALTSTLVDDVYLSTDGEKIRDIGLQFGAKAPFLRPAEFSSDTASTEVVMLHFVEWLEAAAQPMDALILLQATSPLRSKTLIDDCIRTFLDSGAESLLTVVENEHFGWKNETVPEADYDYTNRPRRQDKLPEDIKFSESGSVYITKIDVLKTSKNRLGGKIAMHISQKHEGFEIDDPVDWLVLEALLKEYTRENY